jgi:hypothetical protein
MINLETLADRIARATTRPARAQAEEEVLREIEADAQDTLGRALRANTHVSAAGIRDYAESMAAKVPVMYHVEVAARVRPDERQPVLTSWWDRAEAAGDVYAQAAAEANRRIDALLAGRPAGPPTPTPGHAPAAGGKGRGTAGYWAWIGGGLLALLGLLLGVPLAGLLVGLAFVVLVHLFRPGNSGPVPGLPPFLNLDWLLALALVGLLLVLRKA